MFVFLSFPGYVSRCCSDSDDSSDEDYPAEPPPMHTRKRHAPASKDREGWRREKEEQRGAEGKKERAEKEYEEKQEVTIIEMSEKDMEVEDENGREVRGREIMLGIKANAGTVEQDNWYHTDPRVNSSFFSLSSGSLRAALEESSAAAAARGGGPAKASSRLVALREDSPSLRSQRPTQGTTTLDVHHPFLLEVTAPSPQRQREGAAGSMASAPVRPTNLSYRSNDSSCLCFAELSQGSYLPSPPEATSDEEETEEVEDDDDEEELRRLSKIPSQIDLRLIDKICARSNKTASNNKLDIPRIIPNLTSFCEKRTVCSSAHKGEERLSIHSGDSEPFLTPSPNPPPPIARESASESDDEFFDAQERFTPPVPSDGTGGLLT